MQESGENYLETIWLLRQSQDFVRAVDVASALAYTKPSVSRAIGILKRDGLVEVQPDGNILFTPKGEARALAIYRRHQTITTFLVHALQLPARIAAADACRFEHCISPPVMDAIQAYVARHCAKTD